MNRAAWAALAVTVAIAALVVSASLGVGDFVVSGR